MKMRTRVARIKPVYDDIAVRLFAEQDKWRDVASLPTDDGDGGKLLQAVENAVESDEMQGVIRRHRYHPPLICCHYWEVTLLDGQEIVLRYCSNEERFSIKVHTGFSGSEYISRIVWVVKAVIRV